MDHMESRVWSPWTEHTAENFLESWNKSCPSLVCEINAGNAGSLRPQCRHFYHKIVWFDRYIFELGGLQIYKLVTQENKNSILDIVNRPQ